MEIAGHVSRQMLKHYSHIRMEAKREALQAILEKQEDFQRAAREVNAKQDCSQKLTNGKEIEGGTSLQKISTVRRICWWEASAGRSQTR